MNLHQRLLALLALAALTLSSSAQTKVKSASAPDPSVAAIRADFVNPPDAAKPMVRWWWFGPAVVKSEILLELQQMKADGIQGAEIAFVYPEVLDDPDKGLKNLTFLSPEMLDDVNYAQAEGRKLGLRIDVTLCSGWPYGGPATPLAEAVGSLRTVEVPVAAGATSVSVPTLATGKTFEEVSKLKFRIDGKPVLAVGDTILSAAIANAVQPAVDKPAVADDVARGRNAGPRPPTWDLATAQPLVASGDSIAVTPSDKPRVALFFVSSHTGQQVKRAAVGAEGYVLDPFSHDAVATHLRAVGEPLLSAFGNTPPYAIFSDSLEAFGADWTPSLPAEFQKRRGYDLIPHLPELVAGGTPAAETVRHDYGRTLTELVNENYLTQINDWATAHNTKFRSQTYGEPAVSFSSQNLVGLAEGENPSWRAFSTLRWATSANHVFNHNVSSGETFTWLHSPVFRATPLDMKAEVDIDFLSGENLIFCHGWPYSAPAGEVPEPGWSLYAAAVFNDHNPWHPVMPAVTAYIARISQLLRQGQPANQVAILLPTDDAWASFAPAHTTITGAMSRLITPALMSAILSAGYNVDFIDADAIEKVGLGTHQILVIPPTKRIPLATLRKIDAFASAGGHVVSVGETPSQDPKDGKIDPEFLRLTLKLFLDGPSSDKSAAKKNSTHVADVASLPAALTKAVRPDFQIAATDDATRAQVGFIRRKLASADVYFVTNTGNTPVDTTATFATTHKFAEAWNPDSTVATSAKSAAQPLTLAPYESRVFVLSDVPSAAQFAEKPTQAASEVKRAAKSAVTGEGADAKPVLQPDDRGMVLNIGSAWKVNFISLNKFVDEMVLTDWIADPSTLHYSGEAVYSRDLRLTNDIKFISERNRPVYFEIDGGIPEPAAARPGSGMHANFDPPLHEAALLVVNGQPAGALWHPPYRLEIGKLLRPGLNTFQLRVFNTALNAWSALPPRDYKPLIAKYGDRFQMQDLDKVAPIPSGVTNSINLVMEPNYEHASVPAPKSPIAKPTAKPESK